MASDYRGRVETEYRDVSNSSLAITGTIFKGYSTTSNILYDINTEESDSIQLDNHKRRRSTVDGVGHMDVDLGQQTNISPLNLNSGEIVKHNGYNLNGSTRERESKNDRSYKGDS